MSDFYVMRYHFYMTTIPTYQPPAPRASTVEQLQGLLKRFRYKPGWEFRLDHPGNTIRPLTWTTTPNLLITMMVTDTYRPEAGQQQIGLFVAVPEVTITDERLMDWLKACIAYLEMHELEEWFMVDDSRPYDPHARPAPPVPDLRTFAQMRGLSADNVILKI